MTRLRGYVAILSAAEVGFANKLVADAPEPEPPEPDELTALTTE